LTYILAFAKLENMKIQNDDLKKIRANANKAALAIKALAHPARLLILCHLVDGELSVGELFQHSNLSQSAFSQHLAILRKKRLVKTRKEAQSVFYSVADQKIFKILEVLCETFCG
jgi:DNA-binding transcriptional ArsR family regulator